MTSPLARAHELVSLAQYPQAESLLLRHLRSAPKDPDALHLMCYILAHTGRMEQALFYAQRAAEAAPSNPNALANLGNTLLALNREAEALDTLRRAVSLQPRGVTTATHALALALNSTRRYTQARDLCRDALAANPGSIPLSLDLADSLQNLAQADHAVTLLQDLIALIPGDPLLTGNLAAAANYCTNLSPQQVFTAHTRFAARLSRNLPPPAPPLITDPNPDRPIRLGLIIPDLVKHSVAYFIRPLLERLDTAHFPLFIYYTSPDKVVAPPWPIARHTARRIAWEPLPALDQIVRADRLDMLIDLCGMSTHHRLQLMHIKPAPIQLTYAGYPNTTGLTSIDHRIVDSQTDPPGSDSLATEHLERFDPCFLCYTPPTDAPSAPDQQTTTAPARPFTLGSFNHLPKLNDALIMLWARLINTIPDSRLILKATGLQHPETRAELESRFAAAGLARDRLSLLPPTSTRAEHLKTYSQIDVALDPFPYHGTTTTCEALFMGVPVITRAGHSHVSRVGVSLLSAVNLPELIAATDDQYIAIAAALAQDPARLQSLRSGLRARLQSSPLCDEAAFAQRFQSLLRSIWRRHCNP